MKKPIMLLIITALIACAKEEELPKELLPSKESTEINQSGQLTFDFDIKHTGLDDQQTKAVKSGWEDGDVVYVFFSTVAAPKYLKMVYNGGTWTSIEMSGAEPGTLGLAGTGTMTAVFLPFGKDAVVNSDGGKFVFDKIDYAYYLSCVSTPYTISENKVSGILDMVVPDGFVQFFLTDSEAVDGNALLRETHLTPKAVAGVAADGSLIIQNKKDGALLPGFVYGSGAEKGYLFSGVLSTEARGVSTDYHFNLSLGSYTKFLDGKKTLYRGNSEGHTHRAIILPPFTVWNPGAEMIDLGLSVKWASFNLGASVPEELGNYYAWGETETNDNYTLSTYKWAHDGQITKYCCLSQSGFNGYWDHLSSLSHYDDAAYSELGGYWRMPTSEEWDELLNNCTSTWTTVNGINGRRFTSNNGASIFIPCGYKFVGTSVSASTQNKRADYWSSTFLGSKNNGSVSPQNKLAEALYFNQSDQGISTEYRYYGLLIRPVWQEYDIYLDTGYATIVSSNYAEIEGNITIINEDEPANLYVYYSSDYDSIDDIIHNGNRVKATIDSNGEFEATISGLDQYSLYRFVAVSEKSGREYRGEAHSFVTQSDAVSPATIDLGLSVNWAIYNLGAYSVEDAGNHYAWGETEPKNDYSWATYQWCNGSSTSITKYCQDSSYGDNGYTDSFVKLEYCDDAANVSYGGTWHIPTLEEFSELVDSKNCSWVKETINGIAGYIITSKKVGYTNKWIFLPAAGTMDGTTLNNAGSVYSCNYWSSTYNSPNNQWQLFFSNTGFGMNKGGSRYKGLPIRPVCAKE